MLHYFEPTWDTEVVCDGSPYGLGGILKQTNPKDGRQKVIAYASRSLTDAESRYGQIEREALAIHFACHKFQLYLLGKTFTVITDHKPLVHIFNKPRSQMPYRIERIRMKLLGFSFTVKHTPGTDNPSDFMSRKPLRIKQEDRKSAKELERHVHFVVSEGLPKAVSLSEIANETKLWGY